MAHSEAGITSIWYPVSSIQLRVGKINKLLPEFNHPI